MQVKISTVTKTLQYHYMEILFSENSNSSRILLILFPHSIYLYALKKILARQIALFTSKKAIILEFFCENIK